jgi:hypothetical protein
MWISLHLFHLFISNMACAQYPNLVRTELRVRLDWSASPNDPRTQRVVSLLHQFNNRLYDATDGQWRIRKFHIYDVRGPISSDADGVPLIHEVWETAHDRDKHRFTEDVSRNNIFALNLFKNPAKFHIALSDNPGTVLHEFLHSWTGVLDEYEYPTLAGKLDSRCPDTSAPANNACVMYSSDRRELCRPANHSKLTEQQTVRDTDCYSWIAKVFKFHGKGNLIISDLEIPGPSTAPRAEIEYHLGPPVTWGGNLRVVGQRSKAAPAIARIGNTLYMVHLGDEENRIWFSRSLDGGVTWLGNEVIRSSDGTEPKSKAAPALVAYNNGLVMVHLGDEENTIWVSRYQSGRWLDDKKIEGQKSKATPGLAVIGNTIHMVHIGDQSHDIYHSRSTDGGRSWSQNTRIPSQKSKASPALAAIGNTLYMVHLGDVDNSIWFSTSGNGGENWTQNVRIPGQKSKATPALVVMINRLHMVHIGDESNNIWHSYYNNGWGTNVRIPDQQSKASPSLVVAGDLLHMVHIGNRENDIWYSKGVHN